VLVAQLFDWYLEPQATVCRLARRLTELGVATTRGKPRWNAASVRGILRNPAYTGRALTNRTQVAPARQRKSAMLPAGPGVSHAPRPAEDWIEVPVPPIVSEEIFAQVQAKLDANQQSAPRNTRHEYLLRALVSCGACRLSCSARQSAAGYRYYLCRGRTDPLRVAQGQRCTARYIPAGQLDELVWADLCALLTDPAQVTVTWAALIAGMVTLSPDAAGAALLLAWVAISDISRFPVLLGTLIVGSLYLLAFDALFVAAYVYAGLAGAIGIDAITSRFWCFPQDGL
jgi:site-specific DNA recombinase